MSGFDSFDGETCNRLAARLEALDLTTDERALLDLVLERAADTDEVSGHQFDKRGHDVLSRQEEAAKVAAPDLTLGGLRLATAAGLRF